MDFLNLAAKANRKLFMTTSPLTCYWVLEHHNTHKVMKQFGLRQVVPLQFDMSCSRKEQIGGIIIDYKIVYSAKIKLWAARSSSVLRKAKKTKDGSMPIST